jgi:predicted DNA-binding transcriptional regulator AlpA
MRSSEKPCNPLTVHRGETVPDRGEARDPAAAVEPLLVDRRELARLLSRSLASLDRDTAAGRVPRPLKIGASVRWKLSEIRAWVAAGCPDRETWEAAQHDGRPR